MRRARPGLASLAAAALLAAAPAGCHEEPGGHPDAGDASGPDAQVPDARVPDARADAGPDASPDGQVIQHAFCDEPFFKLPIDGQTDYTASIELDQGRLLWVKVTNYAQQGSYTGLYLLDLGTCVERQLSAGSDPGWADLHGDHVVFSERNDDHGPFCSDLYHLDLSTGIKDRLTQTPGCELEPRTNGRHVVYRWADRIYEPPTVSPTLRLLDLETGDDTELFRGSVDSFDLDERYVVWPGYGPDPQSVGRDLYVHDLETGETRHLDFTFERYQWWVYLWQGWVTIQGTDNGLWDPWSFLQLYHLETGELRTLLELDAAVSAAWIGDGLLGFNSSQYSAQPALNPSDVEVYEVASGLARRITSAQSNLRVRGIERPFLLMLYKLFNPLSFYMNDFYVANLEALDVLDASGNLLPGDPVITPP